MTISRLLQQAASSAGGTAFDLTEAETDTTGSFFSFGDLIDQTDDTSLGTNEDIEIVAVQQETYVSAKHIFVLTKAGKLHRFKINVADADSFSSVATLDVSTHPAIVNSGDRALDFQIYNDGEGLAVLWKDWDGGSSTDYNKILFFELQSPYSLTLAQSPQSDEYYMNATYTKDASCFSWRNSGAYDSGYPFEIFIRDEERDKVAKLSGKTETTLGNPAVPNSSGLTFVHESATITPNGSGSVSRWYSLQVQQNQMSWVSYEFINADSRYETLVRSYDLTNNWDLTVFTSNGSVRYSPPINGWDDREDLSGGDGIHAETGIDNYKGKLIRGHWSTGSTLYLALEDMTTIAVLSLSDSDDATSGTFDRSDEHFTVMEGLGSGEVEYTVSDMYVADDGQYIYWMNNNFDQTSSLARRLYKASLTTPYSLANLTGSAGVDMADVTAYDTGASQVSVPFHLDPTETKLIMCEGEEFGNNISVVSWNLNSRGEIDNKSVTGNKTLTLGGSTDYSYPKAMHVSRDGTRIFILYFVASTDPGHLIFSGTMSTPWDVDTITTVAITTVSPLVSYSGSNANSWFSANGIAFHPAGTKLYVSGVYNDENVIAEWTLGTPWDITDETLVLKHNLTKNTFGPFSGIYMTPTGKHLYAGHTYSNTIVRWDMY
jgi:hypothetical protein